MAVFQVILTIGYENNKDMLGLGVIPVTPLVDY